MATLAYEICQLHPRLNSDLLLTAAIAHDLGRTREFTYGAEIGLTEEGRLLGHLVIGERMISERAGALDEAAPAGAAALRALPPRSVDARPAAGSPRAEALALYRLNALDAAVKGAFEQGSATDSAARTGSSRPYDHRRRGTGLVAHPVFKTGRAGQPPAWKVRFLRRVVLRVATRRGDTVSVIPASAQAGPVPVQLPMAASPSPSSTTR